MKFFLNSLVLALGLFIAEVKAMPAPWPLEEYLGRATIIAVLEITEGKQNELQSVNSCKYLYKVTISQLVRGNAAWSSLMSEAKLTIGSKYLLVAAEEAPWVSRQLGMDIAPSPEASKEPVACKKIHPDAVLARGAELLLLQRNIATNEDWIAIQPRWLQAPTGVTQIFGLERIDVKDYRIEQPAPEVLDYMRLNEVISLARDVVKQK